MRRVTLVTGPPCSGKSRHVDLHAQPGQLIACHDHEARRAGSPRRHDHADNHHHAAQAAWKRLVADIAASSDGTSWVIRCAPEGPERQQLAEQLRADLVLVLMPPLEVALHRAGLDRRSRRTYGVIRGWYRRYSPAPCDTLVQPEPAVSRAW